MLGATVMFVLFIVIYMIISDIITVLFQLTGLTEEKARFQVISLLTNSGFTTAESEIIVHSKIRRTLAKITMIFGYAFSVTIISSLVNIFTNMNVKDLKSVTASISIFLIIFLLFNFFRRMPFIKTKFNKIIQITANKIMFGENSNPISIMDDYGNMVVAKIYLNKVPNELDGIPLEKTNIKQNHNILVMMVKEDNGISHQAEANTILKKKSVVMVLGERKKIREVFEKVK